MVGLALAALGVALAVLRAALVARGAAVAVAALAQASGLAPGRGASRRWSCAPWTMRSARAASVRSRSCSTASGSRWVTSHKQRKTTPTNMCMRMGMHICIYILHLHLHLHLICIYIYI